MGEAKYYVLIYLIDACHPQTIFAYDMNSRLLLIKEDAPLLVRVECQLGYTMPKYLKSIEVVGSFDAMSFDNGGY